MIPKVDLLLTDPAIMVLTETYGKAAVVDAVRELSDDLRDFLKDAISQAESMSGQEKADYETAITAKMQAVVADFPKLLADGLRLLEGPGLCRVVNATGTILHTNLGRAPISKQHAEDMMNLVTGYSNLEYDLVKGKRGERYSHFEKLICRVTGAEAAMAVNNNAAAVLLVLSALGAGKEVVVSRGEQIEIGGKFRIPDVIVQGGAILKEVGCTNKTHLDDYEDAITENTGVLLKVHTSNFRVVGFSDSVTTRELADLAHARGVAFVEDLGSGFVVDLAQFGINNEPTVQEVVAAGADVVCFSGDKLLGGPQAGIIVGKKEMIAKIKKHPLTRALRIDKFTATALELIWKDYNRLSVNELIRQVPALEMLTRSKEKQMADAKLLAEAIKRAISCACSADAMGTGTDSVSAEEAMASDSGTAAAALLASGYTFEAVPMQSQMGGGTLPLHQFDGAGVRISCGPDAALTVEALEERLRKLPVPIIGRIQNGALELHMRTVLEEDMGTLLDEVTRIFA